MNLHPLPAILAAIIFVCINVCFVIAATLEQIPWCFPYAEGCVSISKAAREIPSQQIYRICIAAGASLMLLYWLLCGQWLTRLRDGDAKGLHFVGIGVVAAMLLIVNVALFGDADGTARSVRHACVAGFFVLSTVAGLMFTSRLRETVRHAAWPGHASVVRSKIVICYAQLALGVLTLAAPLFEARDTINNVVEWNFVVLMLLFFMTTGIAWKQTNYRFDSFTAGNGS